VATPLAIVTNIIDIVADPIDPANKTQILWSHRFLFFGEFPLEQQGVVSFLNTLTKTQLKAAVNAQIIASAAALGVGLDTQHILTIADIAG
jgi:hypothetical protein